MSVKKLAKKKTTGKNKPVKKLKNNVAKAGAKTSKKVAKAKNKTIKSRK